MVAAERRGEIIADPNAIANALIQAGTLPANATRRDVQTAARRAVRAVEAAYIARDNPARAPVRADIPFNRGIYANQSEFQYRVVVTSATNGRPDPGGVLVTFGSGDRLTLGEIQARAMREFGRLPQTTIDTYDTRLRAAPSTQTYTAIVVAISRYEQLD